MTDTQPISTATATGKRRTEGEDISQQETKIDTTKKQKKADAASNGATKQKPEVDQQGLIVGESLEAAASRISKTRGAKNWEATVGLKPLRHHYGVNIPVFSLKTEKSCGVGEFMDLMPLIDWCEQNGFDVIQLLPVNDSNKGDNSPFSPISSFSLNPLLISLADLPNMEKQTDAMKQEVGLLRLLNSAERVNWTKVHEHKMEFFRQYFKLSESYMTLSSTEYLTWFKNNRYWLEGYALFCVLKEKFQGKIWEEWPQEISTIPGITDVKHSAEVVDLPGFRQLLAAHNDEINFYMFLQFLAHKQLSAAKDYATQKKVFLKGDIPFLVSRDSADVWLYRGMFDMSKTVGAPPDMYSATGQNWGLPLYNWSAIEQDDFTWWKHRLGVASSYFHLYRIDHIVGFFRVWGIPGGKPAVEGSYVPEDESTWILLGEKFLGMMLDSCNMLPIGEDLGTIPKQVRASLQQLGICGTKVMRWERVWEDKEHAQPQIPLEKYNLDSMTTVSTHDSDTLTLWWDNYKEEAKAYCVYKGWDLSVLEKPLSRELRQTILADSMSSPSLFHINLLQEYLGLVPSLVHTVPSLEKINTPATVSQENWSYRMLPTIEHMTRNQELTDALKQVIPKQQQTQAAPKQQ